MFEERPKLFLDVIGDVYCPCKYCFNREKCEPLDGYVTTPRSIYGCGKCGAWLFVHKAPFTLQEHVRTTKADKTRFFFEKKVKMLHDKQLFIIVPFQSSKYRQKNLCVDDKVRETFGDSYCQTCRNEMRLYFSTNKTSSFYDCNKYTACFQLLNIPFKDQKPTIMLFGGKSIYCFARKTSRAYGKEKLSAIL